MITLVEENDFEEMQRQDLSTLKVYVLPKMKEKRGFLEEISKDTEPRQQKKIERINQIRRSLSTTGLLQRREELLTQHHLLRHEVIECRAKILLGKGRLQKHQLDHLRLIKRVKKCLLARIDANLESLNRNSFSSTTISFKNSYNFNPSSTSLSSFQKCLCKHRTEECNADSNRSAFLRGESILELFGERGFDKR
eukprot:TRINITY_DN22495_c0_g1_i1.p1 TRINITY_DN22495_c0_g1~~TRINITY_DN22495_c0_g1_i1.p1  ORF type:complete len:195 (-),score=34.30 TRINITY_DN22495_c0_g1_i1:119-703(-)